MKKSFTRIDKRSKARKIWIPILVVLLIAAGGLGYFYWKQLQTAQAAAPSEVMSTTTVRTGSILLSVTGSGTLDAGQEKNLAFSTSGTVDSVNVEIGDPVKKGDVLAVLSNLSALQDDINAAQIELNSVQNTLETLEQSAASNLAEAQLAVVNAQKAVTDAKSDVVQDGWQRCDQPSTNAYYAKYLQAKEFLESLGDGAGDSNYYNTAILPQKNIVAQAQANYEYCVGYTDYEVSASQAALLVAEAGMKEAQETLDTLTENDGIDPIELATAENKVSSAQLKVETAKEALAGATLTAPFDGTILSVAGDAGERVSTDSFITIADLNNPLVNFSADEADMDKIAEGQAAEVTFDALSSETFYGSVTRIDPSLTQSNGYKVVTGVITLDLSQSSAGANQKLIKGLSATVSLVQASAENVVLAPVEALRDLGDGTFAVFVVGPDNKLRMTVVEVGLKDDTYAEIKSGLKAGDVVSTGTSQVN